jgi:hypothetical protein
MYAAISAYDIPAWPVHIYTGSDHSSQRIGFGARIAIKQEP